MSLSLFLYSLNVPEGCFFDYLTNYINKTRVCFYGNFELWEGWDLPLCLEFASVWILFHVRRHAHMRTHTRTQKHFDVSSKSDRSIPQQCVVGFAHSGNAVDFFTRRTGLMMNFKIAKFFINPLMFKTMFHSRTETRKSLKTFSLSLKQPAHWHISFSLHFSTSLSLSLTSRSLRGNSCTLSILRSPW